MQPPRLIPIPARLALLFASLLLGLAVACGDGSTPASPQPNAGSAPVSATPAADAARLPAPSATGPWCLASNPHCGQTWWVEYSDTADSRPVQFDGLGPGFVVDTRLAEAVLFLAHWQEGRDLLTTAAGYGLNVDVVSPTDSYAACYCGEHRVTFSAEYLHISSFLLAEMLAHELNHLRDHVANRNQQDGYQGCIAREQASVETERRFLTWVNQSVHPLPSQREVRRELSSTDQGVYGRAMTILTTNDLHGFVLRNWDKDCHPR